MNIPVGLSTASVMPASVEECFILASKLGYDGVEVMVLTSQNSRDPERIKEFSQRYQMPVLAIHAPTLLLTQGVWGTNPWDKIDRSVELAEEVGASVVVLHPPFWWQRSYAREFVAALKERSGNGSQVRLAVENMFPWRAKKGRVGKNLEAYLPGWDPTEHEYDAVTLDLSHAATSRMTPDQTLGMAKSLGDRLVHLHLTDGSGSFKDEHLVPGRGTQPCAEVLEHLVESDYQGSVVVEINSRGVSSTERVDMLIESLRFARTHLGQAAE